MHKSNVQRDWEQLREEILSDTRAHGWLAAALRSALGHEPLAVANDVELLVAILRGRCRELEENAAGPPAGLFNA